MVVGCLSVIPLLASFYPLAYYAKDFDDRKDICDVFVLNHEYAEYAIAELVNLGSIYTYSVQQMVTLVALGISTLGLLVSACMVQTGRQPCVPAQVLVAPGMPGGIVTTGGGAPGGPVRTLGAAGLGGGVVNPVYLVQQQPQLSHSSQLVYLQQVRSWKGNR